MAKRKKGLVWEQTSLYGVQAKFATMSFGQYGVEAQLTPRSETGYFGVDLKLWKDGELIEEMGFYGLSDKTDLDAFVIEQAQILVSEVSGNAKLRD